jgi:integrase
MCSSPVPARCRVRLWCAAGRAGRRHTAASLAIQAGANPKVVQRMLGHASATAA